MSEFTEKVWAYYEAHGRHDLPWRRPGAGSRTPDPYHVLVSEVMLQQTQVPRVIPAFEAFLAAFPTLYDLAEAPLGDVLRLWSGLGYNRRAKFLRQAAGIIAAEYGGAVPRRREDLVRLPGIGPNTAGAVLAYAYNEPAMFIETNIRSVFIHHFFPGAQKVADADLTPFIEASLPPGRARGWYWALMDYGTHLKQTVGNASRASRHHSVQSAFHGSRRKVRGQVLKLLVHEPATAAALQTVIDDERLTGVLDDLVREGLIVRRGLQYSLGA